MTENHVPAQVDRISSSERRVHLGHFVADQARVDVHNPVSGGVWPGVTIVGLLDEPGMLIERPDGSRWMLPQSFAVAPVAGMPGQPSEALMELRDQIRRALTAYDTDIDARAADAVLPVVGAACAAARDEAREQKQRAEQAEAQIAEVRRLQNMTIATSCRAHANEQAKDALAALDRAATKAHPTEVCGDEHAETSRRCALPAGHDAHRSGGTAWTYLRDNATEAAVAAARNKAEELKAHPAAREILAAIDAALRGEVSG